MADKIREALREPLRVEGNDLYVTASIGITMFPSDARKPAVLVKYADTAMYDAKQAGRDVFRFFKPQMNSEVRARLELELTESALIAGTQLTIATLQKLRARGVQLSIDDFGTGYSCLSYPHQFAVDKLKIDISFIRNVTTNPADAARTETILRIAHRLNMDVIAEGVETAAQLSHLVRQGCDQVQGYYFSRPLPLAEVEELLRRGTTLTLPDDTADVSRAAVLLIDDDNESLIALVRLLDHDGYQIITAASPSEALELLALHQVHVIVGGGALASSSGFLELLKDLHPGSLRIVLSGRTTTEVVIETVNRGAVYAFYTKPWDGDVLRDKVREACRHYRRLHDGPVTSPLAPAGDRPMSR